MNRAVIYARVSTEQQNGKDFVSLDSQIASCQTYCNQHGYQVMGIFTDVVSGTATDRIGFDAILTQAKSKMIDLVVIFDSSRFARSVLTSAQFREQLKMYDVALHYSTEGDAKINTSAGNMIETFRSVQNEYWLEMIKTYTLKGKYERSAKGQYVLSRVPFGYIKANNALHINEEKASIVRLIYTLYDQHGYSVSKIANYLNDQHISTPSSKSKLWGDKTVYVILTNTAYVGYVRFGKTFRKKQYDFQREVSIPVPAIVDADVFERVQEKLKVKKIYTSHTDHYLLQGRVFCECGYRCSGSSYRHRYYLCTLKSNNKKYPDKHCTASRYRQDALDIAVWNYIETQLLDENNLRQTLELRKKEQESDTALALLKDKLLTAQRNIANNEQEQQQLLQSSVKGLFPSHIVEREVTRLTGEYNTLLVHRNQLEQEIAGYTLLTDEGINDLVAFTRIIRDKLHTIRDDIDAQRHILDLLQVKVTLSDKPDEKTFTVTSVLGVSSKYYITIKYIGNIHTPIKKVA